jgi:hypothetical protein
MTRRFLVPLSADHVDYNLSSASENSEGRLRWDSDFGTLSIGMEGGDVELPIGQKNGAYVKNVSGVNIGKGQAVQFAGAQGGKIQVAKAVSDGTVPSKYMFGITAEAIDDDGFGFVVTEGYIRGLNTSNLTIGDLLYFDPNTPGNLTATEPPSTAFNIPIAAVTFVNANAGVIYVRMNMEYELKEIEDVFIDELSDGQALIYDSSLNKWKNSSPPTPSTPSGSILPLSATDGTFFYNTTNEKLYFYFNGWQEVSTTVLNEFDGGNSSTTEFVFALDGGNSSDTEFEPVYDGGSSLL